MIVFGGGGEKINPDVDSATPWSQGVFGSLSLGVAVVLVGCIGC